MDSQWPHSTGSTPLESTQNHHKTTSEYRRYRSHTPTNTQPVFAASTVSSKLDSHDSPRSSPHYHRDHTSKLQSSPHHRFQGQNYPSTDSGTDTHVQKYIPSALRCNSPKMQHHRRLPSTHSPEHISEHIPYSDGFPGAHETPEMGHGPAEFEQYPPSTFLLDSLAADVDVTGSQNYDFALDAMEFIEPSHLGHESRAFPPSAYPENTPALGPVQRPAPPQRALSQPVAAFQSPILPSQNNKSYNKDHFMHKQRQQQLNRSNTEAGFTPLASPAVTPLQKHVHAPVKTEFEPLTSPALKAQSQAGASNTAMGSTSGPASASASASASSCDTDRRRLSSTAFAANDYSQTHTHSAKRRTPHSTPQLAAVPSKLKREPSVRDSQSIRSSESTPMLPPQGRAAVIDSNSHQGHGYNPGSSPAAAFGPGAMMGFTMNRLAQQQGSSGGEPDSHADHQLDIHSNSTSAPPYTSSSETSPMLEPISGEMAENSHSRENLGLGRRDRVPGKKTSHKIAEQGRRIRMNQAVHELSRLIPESLQEGVAVPSKATTIELAAAYIRTLLHELDSKKAAESS